MRYLMLQWHREPDPTSPGAYASYEQGRVYDLDEATAAKFMAAGLCEPFGDAVAAEPELAAPAAAPEPEPTIEEKPSGRRKRPENTED